MTSSKEPASQSLQYQLDEITANTRALVPPERLALTEQLIANLQTSGLEQQILPVNAGTPSFQLTAASNKSINSDDLLALGPVVLKFFRGRWDPYDMTELEAWQSLQPTLREHRALLVAVSPQTPRQNAFTADRHKLTFPILSDPTCTLAAQFRLAYTVPDVSRVHFRAMLVNIPFLNGNDSWRLPLPATYILDSSGKVLFAEAHADHRIRPEPTRVLDALIAAN